MLLYIAFVSEVSVLPLNSTSVKVSDYIVHYTTVGGVSETDSFPATFSSEVVTVTINSSRALFTGSPIYTKLSCEPIR